MVHLVVQQKKRQNYRARGVDGKREIKVTVVYRVSLTASVVTKMNERALSYVKIGQKRNDVGQLFDNIAVCGSRFDSWLGKEIFLFSITSHPAS
jgi:hypothetical protein